MTLDALTKTKQDLVSELEALSELAESSGAVCIVRVVGPIEVAASPLFARCSDHVRMECSGKLPRGEDPAHIP